MTQSVEHNLRIILGSLAFEQLLVKLMTESDGKPVATRIVALIAAANLLALQTGREHRALFRLAAARTSVFNFEDDPEHPAPPLRLSH
jgi:hypothetical protein